MNVAIVGCGFVADYYLVTLPLHPELKVLGVTDLIPERADLLSRSYGVQKYAALIDVLNDKRVELVLNLTNPRSCSFAPPGIAGMPVSFFGLSASIASVVMRMPAIEAAS